MAVPSSYPKLCQAVEEECQMLSWTSLLQASCSMTGQPALAGSQTYGHTDRANEDADIQHVLCLAVSREQGQCAWAQVTLSVIVAHA